MSQQISRRTVLVVDVAALAGSALVRQRPVAAQAIVGPVEGAPTLVMFHVEAGW